MYTVLSTLFCIAGWITALIVNVVWYGHCDKMNNEWYKRCLSINETWADLCMELIDEGADRIKGSKRLVKGSDSCDGCIYDSDENVLACVACVLKDKQSGKE